MTAVRRSIAVCAAIFLVGGIATGVSQVAGAEPKPTISQVQAQVNELTAKYNKAVQQYDQVAQQLTQAKAKLKQVNKEMSRDQTRYTTSRKRVIQIANASFEDSGQTSLAGLLTSSNPSAVLNAASMLLQLAGTRNQQTRIFLSAAQQLSSVQATQQHTEYGISQLAKQRAKTRDSIQKLLDSKKSTLDSLTAQQQAAVQANSLGGSSSGAASTATSVPAGTSGQAAEAVQYALDQVNNCWYVYGAAGPCSAGFDCSGLVMAAWAAAGVTIPRDTYEQWAALPHISMSSLRPGDLIYYDGEGHVAMYVGNNMIVDAPQTGMKVEEISMDTSWYADNTDGAVRP